MKAVMFSFVNCLGCPFVVFNENEECACGHPEYEEDKPVKITDDYEKTFGYITDLDRFDRPYFPDFCLLKDGEVINYKPVNAKVMVKEIE